MKKGLQLIQKGFTLVELLIVVIIIAILAAVLVPQFSGSTDDARLASLDSTLANMRTAVDLYYQQHGHWPGSVTSIGTACATAGGATGTGAANTQQAFIDQLTRYTSKAGESCTATDATMKYGPYLKKDLIPDNPFTDINTIKMETTGTLPLQGEVTPGGWRYDVKTGQFIANHQSYDDR